MKTITKYWQAIVSDSTGQYFLALQNTNSVPSDIYRSTDFGSTFSVVSSAPTTATYGQWMGLASSSDFNYLGAIVFQGLLYISTSSKILISHNL